MSVAVDVIQNTVTVSENNYDVTVTQTFPTDGGGGGAVWGSITGNIADQADLQAILNGKQASSAVLTATTASFTTALATKLNGISTGATANISDATLLDRTNHTGTQAISTIIGLQTALNTYNNGLTQKGWWAFGAPVSGGYRAIGSGGIPSITGSASSFDLTKNKKHGLCVPIATSSGASWRHGVEDNTRLFVYDTSNEFTGGVAVINFITPSAMTNYRMQCGIGDGVVQTAADNDIAVAAGIFFRASSNASDTNWMWYTNGVSASTPISTGVPIAADCKMQATITFNRTVNSYTIRLKNLTTGADSNDIAVTLNISSYVGNGVLGFVGGKDLLSATRTMYGAVIGSYCFGA